jgi:hypothetical protein
MRCVQRHRVGRGHEARTQNISSAVHKMRRQRSNSGAERTQIDRPNLTVLARAPSHINSIGHHLRRAQRPLRGPGHPLRTRRDAFLIDRDRRPNMAFARVVELGGIGRKSSIEPLAEPLNDCPKITDVTLKDLPNLLLAEGFVIPPRFFGRFGFRERSASRACANRSSPCCGSMLTYVSSFRRQKDQEIGLDLALPPAQIGQRKEARHLRRAKGRKHSGNWAYIRRFQRRELMSTGALSVSPLETKKAPGSDAGGLLRSEPGTSAG